MSATIEESAPPPAGLRLATRGSVSPAETAAADAASARWIGDSIRGAVAVGSDLHERIVCRMFRETCNPHKPSVIDWPKLSQEARDRLVTLPTLQCRLKARRSSGCCPMPAALPIATGVTRSH